MIALCRAVIERAGVRLMIAVNGLRAGPHPVSVPLPVPGALGEQPAAAAGQSHWDGDPPRLACAEPDELFEPLRLRENCEYDFALTLPLTPAQFATALAASGNPVFPFANPALVQAITLNGPEACGVESDGRFRLTGRLNFGSHAGVAHLDLEPAVANFALAVEVMTAKLEYEEEFRTLLSDLSDRHAELVLRLDSPTETALRKTLDREPSAQTEMLHLRRLMRDDVLPAALATIVRRPAYRCRSTARKEAAAFATHPDLAALQSNPLDQDWMTGGPLSETFRGFTPLTLPTRATEFSYDIPENRYVKFRIEELLYRMEALLQQAPAGSHSARFNLERWAALLRQLLQHPFWLQVSARAEDPNSMILIERMGYREFSEAMLSFDYGLLLDSAMDATDPVSGDLRPVFDLYELWCFFKLHDALSALAGEGTPPIGFRRSGDGYAINLNRGSREGTGFRCHHASGEVVELTLYYQYEFRPISAEATGWSGAYSAAFHPDFTVRVVIRKAVHWLHFDAKYKLDRDEWTAMTAGAVLPRDQQSKSKLTYRRMDLHTMHTYRDALLGSRGSYILYPGNTATPDIFTRHAAADYRAGYPIPSVGAFPLRPSADATQAEQLAALTRFFRDAIHHLATTPVYNEETALEQG